MKMGRELLMACLTLIVSARAQAHVMDGGTDPGSCSPHGATSDVVGCVFDDCHCTVQRAEGEAFVPCPGGPAADLGAFVEVRYERFVSCPVGLGPTLTEPDFTGDPALPGCGHSRQTVNAEGMHGLVLNLFTVAGKEALQNDWTHACAPVAAAGADQAVCPGDTVTLDGSPSADPNGQTLSVQWKQTSGAAVSLTQADTLKPTLTAPELPGEVLVFELTVADPLGVASPMAGGGTASDAVMVTVRADCDQGGGCAVGRPAQAPGAALLPWLLGAACLLWPRGRRNGGAGAREAIARAGRRPAGLSRRTRARP